MSYADEYERRKRAAMTQDEKNAWARERLGTIGIATVSPMQKIQTAHATTPVPSGTIQAAPMEPDSFNGWDWVTANEARGRIERSRDTLRDEYTFHAMGEAPPGYRSPRIADMVGQHPITGARLVFTDPAIAKAEYEATSAERARILAKLQELKPPHRPRTHGDWARGWREAGELAMWERMVKALEGGE